MKKNSRRISPLQTLIILLVLGAAALLRGLGGENGSVPRNPTADLSQLHVDVQPTRKPGTSTPKANFTRTPKSTTDRQPTATNAGVALDALDEFDFFVLALSWSPDYCASNGNNDPQQCSTGRKLGFVLHGLWPQYERGYPSNCSTQKMPESVKSQFPGLYPNDSLFNHEWGKHGTCTGLSALDYLRLSEQFKDTVTVPPEFRSPEKAFRTSVAQIKTLFAQSNPDFGKDAFEVSCSGSGRYLKEIFVCFSREGAPVACSAEMRKTAQKSCQAADFLVRNTR